MRIPMGRRWWLLTAAATLSICLTSPTFANFLQVPELNALGLGFKVLPPMCMILRPGHNATVPCQPIEREKGVANVTWVRDSMVINDERRYVLPNGTLIINKVEESDRGIYRCVLTTGNYSVTSAFVYFMFAVTGVWQIKPRNNTVEEGRAVRLTCHMASLPDASYIWLKDNRTLPENESRYYHPNPGVLQITNVNFQDEGMFRCKAVNSLLKMEFLSRGGYLTVVPRASEEGASFQHSLLAVPSKVEVHEGEKAVLECITDDEEPLLEWSRIDGNPIPENSTIRRGQGSLVFPSVTEQDIGVYNCSAVSKKSGYKISTQMIELSVMTPPRVQLSMTVSKRPTPLSKKISNGQSIRITCATWGQPVPIISWYKNGVLHVESGRHQYTNKNSSKTFATEDLFIGIIMFKDTGVYQCVTRNKAGVASDGFVLNIHMAKNMPKPPINIRAVEVTPYSIKLSWTELPNSNVSGYIIIFSTDKSTTEKQSVSNKTSVTIKELKPNTNYIIYIRSFFIKNDSAKALFGEPSENIRIKTKDDCPTRMPVVKLYPKSPTELYANWTLLDYKNQSPITEQKLQWKKKNQHYHDGLELPPNVTDYTISYLIPNKAYKVRVLVSTSAGYPMHLIQLPWYTVKMPRNISEIPQDNAFLTVHLSTCSQRPTEILVNWTLDASLQKELINYRVFYNASSSSWQHQQPATDTSLTLTDIDPETCYGVRVQAVFNDKRNNTSSPLKTICTLSQPPFLLPLPSNTNKIRVKRLRTKVLNTTSVLITWKHASRKVLVDFYTIKVENVKSELDRHATTAEEKLSEESEVDSEPRERGARSPRPTYEEDAYILGVHDSESNVPLRREIRLYRVTSRRITVTNLRPLHNYSVTVTASTTTLTGHPSITFVTPDEGVPTPPLNVTWVPASPKDAVLTWSPPRSINGRLIHYLVAFSHDEQEWRNHTISPHSTTTKIQDLVSNTNYTLHIAGVTGKGVGASTTVFIYIRATLEGEPHITTELAVISVVSLLVVITCVVAVLLCHRILRLRNNSPSVFQADGTCEGMEPLRDGLSHHRMLDALDDIDDADDGSRRLLHNVSTAQPVFSKNMKEFNPRSMYNSTQVDHHSSTDGAGMDPAVSS